MADTDFVTIAKVVKTQGRIGEVATEIFTDFPEKFAERKKLFALLPDDSRRELELEDAWPHKGQMVLKFVGVDSISDAELLIGSEIQITKLWSALSVERERVDEIRNQANALRKTADKLDSINAALDCPIVEPQA